MRLVDTLRLFRSLLPLGFGASFAATTPKPARHASAGTLIVRVIDAQSHAPIPNAQVTDVDVSVQRLTTAMGEARFDWGDRPVVHARVRQLGYRFAERTIRSRPLVTSTVLTGREVPGWIPRRAC